MRLIDAKQLEKQVKEAFETQNPVLMGQMLRWIRKQKTIDTVPVVRCKKCVHYERGVCLKIYDDGAASRYAWQERNPDDFCSYGERKEGAD